MGNILFGMSFFKEHCVLLDIANKMVQFPDNTLQLKPERGQYIYEVHDNKSIETRTVYMIELRRSRKTVTQPDQPLFVPDLMEKDLDTITSTLRAFPAFEQKTKLLLSSALAQIT